MSIKIWNNMVEIIFNIVIIIVKLRLSLFVKVLRFLDLGRK